MYETMKRETILPLVAILCLLLSLLLPFGWGVLTAVVIIPLAFLYYRSNKTRERNNIDEHSRSFKKLEEVTIEYGEPDDVVVLDASKANELPSLILFYHSKDLMIVEGNEVKISDVESVAPKNMATPYTIDEFAVIINTRNPQYKNIHLRVGYDGGMAKEIACQIYENIK